MRFGGGAMRFGSGARVGGLRYGSIARGYGGRRYYYGGRRFAYGLGALGILGAGLAYNSCYVWTPYGWVNQCGYGYYNYW
jgi:hypothetical protein